MNIVDCESPVRVFNKYIGEHVWIGCGKCKTCMKKKSSRWVARLEVERSQHLACFFVTLTYDNSHLPILVFDDKFTRPDMLIDFRHSDVEVNVNELSFLTAADRQYFDMRIAANRGIPYANFSDIQKFHKRLNKYFKNHATNKYQNFRFFTVSEYGSTTLRPHFHSIYFVDEQSVADCFEEGVLACWKNGGSRTESVKKSAASYCAQYINKLFDLPSFYSHHLIRPKFVCSKRPPIGTFAERPEDLQEIFDREAHTRCFADKKNPSELVNVPVLQCIKNRLFPKIKGFKYISHSLRVELYGLACRQFDKGLPYLRSFEEFKYFVRKQLVSRPLYHACSSLAEYLSLVSHALTEKGVECLKRLYFISKRVLRQCVEYGVTLEEYVSKIESYWNAAEYSMIRQFFEWQQSYSGDSETLVYAYPEFCFKVNPDNWRDLSAVSLSRLVDCPAYQSFCLENQDSFERLTKSHFKNAYLEQIKEKDNFLFILLTLYYAKKRNETFKTRSESFT